MPLEFPSDARRRPTREEHYVLEDLPERERMLWGALAYIAFPVSLLYARWDPFVRFHARQGVGVWIGWALGKVWHDLAWTNELPEVSWLGYVLVTIAACYGIRHALSLEFRAMPWIGWLVHRLPLPKHLAEPPLARRR